MGQILLSLLLSINLATTFQPSAEDSTIEMTVLSFFDAMNQGDSASLDAILHEEGIMQTVTEREGRVVLMDGSRDNFIQRISEMTGQLREDISNLKVLQDGPMATVWMDYQFYFQEELHHCGVNMFHLAFLEGKWKVVYVCDTRRACE